MLRLSSLLITIILILAPAGADAQSVFGGDKCRDRVSYEVSREHRLYRAMLFGKYRAKHAPVNDVRYDKDGMTWIKTDAQSTPWKNLDPDQQGLSWSNDTMDANDEHKDFIPIRGIFETKRVSTSELLPYLLQSIRALDCRLDVVCKTVDVSITKTGNDPVDIPSIEPEGCIKFNNLKTFQQCHIEKAEELSDSLTYCTEIVRQMKQREISLLKLAVEYDAGYRSLLQFAGNFDLFLREIRWPITGTVRQAAELIGKLGRIPCFLSSCDLGPGTKPK
ncbi:hypothetical protein FJZ28_00705 [Candidatus Peregrinibacteria bacterium]|nr:hypothetical protein [Candidatus Peregrinibacteria bacterium]